MAGGADFDFDELDRSKRIFLAISAGVSKDDYEFEKDADRKTWDTLAREIAEIRAKGGSAEWPA